MSSAPAVSPLPIPRGTPAGTAFLPDWSEIVFDLSELWAVACAKPWFLPVFGLVVAVSLLALLPSSSRSGKVVSGLPASQDERARAKRVAKIRRQADKARRREQEAARRAERAARAGKGRVHTWPHLACRWKKDGFQCSKTLERWVCLACGVDAYTSDGAPPKEFKRQLQEPQP